MSTSGNSRSRTSRSPCAPTRCSWNLTQPLQPTTSQSNDLRPSYGGNEANVTIWAKGDVDSWPVFCLVAGVGGHSVQASLLRPPPLPPAQVPVQEAPSLPLPDKPSIVVLPFTNMSNDPEQEYFSDGITEDSHHRSLEALQPVRHRPQLGLHLQRQSGEGPRGQPELGVRYVLEGSVRKADNQVRITAQLIDATTGQSPMGRAL